MSTKWAREVVMLTFEQMYQAFLEDHARKRSGERQRRLKEGHGHAERAFLEMVWWPVFQHFEGLHPEYEVRDYTESARFIDLAYIDPAFRVAIEIDGYGPHVQRISRHQHSINLRRQNQLVIDGWYVLRFSYDDVVETPQTCQRFIQQLFGKLLGRITISSALQSLGNANEREIVRLALEEHGSFTRVMVCHRLAISPNTASKFLRNLVIKRWIIPANGKQRIASYVLHPSKRHLHMSQ